MSTSTSVTPYVWLAPAPSTFSFPTNASYILWQLSISLLKPICMTFLNTASCFFPTERNFHSITVEYIYIEMALCRTVDSQMTASFACFHSCTKACTIGFLSHFPQKSIFGHKFLNIEQQRTEIWGMPIHPSGNCFDEDDSKTMEFVNLARINSFSCTDTNNWGPKISPIYVNFNNYCTAATQFT